MLYIVRSIFIFLCRMYHRDSVLCNFKRILCTSYINYTTRMCFVCIFMCNRKSLCIVTVVFIRLVATINTPRVKLVWVGRVKHEKFYRIFFPNTRTGNLFSGKIVRTLKVMCKRVFVEYGASWCMQSVPMKKDAI